MSSIDQKTQIKKLLDRMRYSDRNGATLLVEEFIAQGLTPNELIDKVLDPALIKLGILWSSQNVSLSQTFVAAKIAEDILCRCIPSQDSLALNCKGSVVIGNIEDDFHSLGRRIISSFLSAGGWEVHDLGNDVTAAEFIDKALEVNASVIGVSAMMQTTALNIRVLRDLIDERGLTQKLKLAVGGAVFNWRPELVQEVGGDGTCANAADVDRLFIRLKNEVEESHELL